jgi:predicted NBD/HSP70 family sugar kinase
MSRRVVAGIDLGGTAINYTFLDSGGRFLIEGLCEHPARSVEGPDVCLTQIVDGLAIAAGQAGLDLSDVVAIGLDTPGPASADGVLSRRGSTNFAHAAWAGFDIRAGVSTRTGLPVTYLNDGNAAALWGHVALFGDDTDATSVAAIVDSILDLSASDSLPFSFSSLIVFLTLKQ